MSEIVQNAGENWLVVSLVPHKGGMMVEVKAHPLVEEMMRGGTGDKNIQNVADLGRYSSWEPVDEAPLRYYRTDNRQLRDDSRQYVLSGVGMNIVSEDERINLSFLSLVGISEGVRFISTKETYPYNYRRQLKVKIADAFRDFVREYIRPIKITLVMTSREF